ncbi:hypothetical protein Q8G28_03880 [Lysinibacillus capsici]|uniref:hypothetical protein n=1 Tax=Lysinibacillus capsici TaxID=2115968 RepID=UPI00272FED23|nr:hypothetical protein [Lysinibacillus capsici]MDP1392003.1 hypothetical protein [Lysinibacillus capsici]MDP1412479.1 hypothetical protein [Lysinibacillus capsici]MDP1428889.1 hypothetical protein [Lysinibacillus capsici]
MTKLYTWVFNEKPISEQKFCELATFHLNVDVETLGYMCIGYEKNGNYTFRFKDNKISLFLSDDFIENEFDELRKSLKNLSDDLEISSTTEFAHFEKKSPVIV